MVAVSEDLKATKLAADKALAERRHAEGNALLEVAWSYAILHDKYVWWLDLYDIIKQNILYQLTEEEERDE
jgi:hypothetical protein